ncbi:Thiamin biosynthesis lipoprotein ApbE [Lunatimonas lonarensis]|uniref:FAD:protein FMN transferase n=1 Tax=Lunatimonas lonarensis TaxID=1232681 RepID=R7ZVS1_9BACT|nr:FAD:protein FMN transferase [Lunatimonas lonarensis]EON78084.1 Thiamin biosynthesis lipoprotein ApbE [Lunatimonas lonarensis]
MKKEYYIPIIIGCLVLALALLNTFKNKTIPYILIEGEALGTYFQIHYQGDKNFSLEINEFFEAYNFSANTYIPDSEISIFNRLGEIELLEASYLPEMLDLAILYHTKTGGVIDPTMMPLINAWGFGFGNRTTMTQQKVDSLLTLVSIHNVEIMEGKLISKIPGTMLDFSAMGEGFAIDKLSELLISYGVENFKVEIGGEMGCKGLNPTGEIWKIGIESPYPSGPRLLHITLLDNQALSTSGNYRKYYIDENGNKRVHIIDPQSGFPVSHNLLSATIKAQTALEADVFATACMIWGPEKARFFIENNKAIEGFLVYEENSEMKTWTSSGL